MRLGTALYVGMQTRVFARTEDLPGAAPNRNGARHRAQVVRATSLVADWCKLLQIAGFDGVFAGCATGSKSTIELPEWSSELMCGVAHSQRFTAGEVVV